MSIPPNPGGMGHLIPSDANRPNIPYDTFAGMRSLRVESTNRTVLTSSIRESLTHLPGEQFWNYLAPFRFSFLNQVCRNNFRHRKLPARFTEKRATAQHL